MAELRKLHAGQPDLPALIFVHGLGGDLIDTWRHADRTAGDCWPHWLGQDLGCDVWTLGYDADLSAWKDQAMPLPDQGDQVADLLATEPALDGRRLALIGHSMGGLVIKTLLINGRTKGDPRIEDLVSRICAVAFVATPHGGSQLASLAKAVRWALRTNVQVGNMSLHDAHLRSLNQQFRSAVQAQKIEVRAYAERKGVPIGFTVGGLRIRTGFRAQVVDVSSADPGLTGVTTVPMAGDHFSICKPADKNQHIHKSVRDFLKNLPASDSGYSVPVASAVRSGQQVEAAPARPAIAPLVNVFLSVDKRESGRLTGASDKRLQPREQRLYGRQAEVAMVLDFLRGNADVAVVTALVAGVGGIGKTEICKAALKRWLGESPGAVAYYVDVPDRSGVGELIDRVASALGLQGVDSLAQLLAVMPPALYYLDNLESVAEDPEGQQALRALKDLPGVRLLASSRVSLPGVLGKPILVDVLPAAEAMALFRDLWAGSEALPSDALLQPFVVGQLGGHALAVTLAARLGDCLSYAQLVKRWAAAGTDSAQDPQDQSRLGSLPISLRLTADALARHEGALALWTVASLFATGVPDVVLSQLETLGGWSQARPWLVRHHILTRRDDHWHMLPPLARYALDASLTNRAGFNWAACRAAPQTLFGNAVQQADSIASTADALAARSWLVGQFGALARLVNHDLAHPQPDLIWLQRTHGGLINQYQFRAVVSRDLLVGMQAMLPKSASALLALADLESRLGRPDQARGLYDRALALYEGEQKGLGQANTLKALGDLENRLGRPKQARELYDRALALYEREQAGLGQANTLKSLGQLESLLGRPDQARVLYDRALALFEQEQDGLGQANTLRALGELNKRLGRPDQARVLYDRALALYEAEQDVLGQANALRVLGDLEKGLGQSDRARGLYDRALALYEGEQAGLGQANTLLGLGELERRLGRPDQARGLYERALALYEAEQDALGQANTLLAQGELESRLDQPDQARGLYDRALELYEGVQDGLGQANTLKALGDLENRLGRPRQARELYDRALALYEGEQAGLGLANTLQALGDLQRSAESFDEAAATYQRALSLYATQQTPMGLAYTFSELARCLHALQREAQRDEALISAFSAAERAHVESVSRYVSAVLAEVTGGTVQARAWLEERGRSAA